MCIKWKIRFSGTGKSNLHVTKYYILKFQEKFEVYVLGIIKYIADIWKVRNQSVQQSSRNFTCRFRRHNFERNALKASRVQLFLAIIIFFNIYFYTLYSYIFNIYLFMLTCMINMPSYRSLCCEVSAEKIPEHSLISPTLEGKRSFN